MNRRTVLCLLAAATLAACGQPSSPGSPPPAPDTEVTTTSTTSTTDVNTTGVAPPPVTTTTTAQPKPPPPPPRTTTKPPPPPPKPPDRLVLSSRLRGSVEQQTGIEFRFSWKTISGQIAEVCPGGVLCVGYTRVVDTSVPREGDCVVLPGGISVPDPLFVGGKITFRVNNDLCSEG